MGIAAAKPLLMSRTAINVAGVRVERERDDAVAEQEPRFSSGAKTFKV